MEVIFMLIKFKILNVCDNITTLCNKNIIFTPDKYFSPCQASVR